MKTDNVNDEINKNDILGPAPVNPSDDPQFSHWEIPIQNWWARNTGL